MFIGDSITAGWSEQASFQAHKNWINKGISGQSSAQVARRFQNDVVDLHPGTVHIIVGTNDVYSGWVLCNSKAPYIATATTPPTGGDTCSDVFYMLETAKRNQIKVVIGTIPPWGCSSDPLCTQPTIDVTPQRYDRITQLNSWIKMFGAEEGAIVVDYHTALTNAEGLHYANGLTQDGVHPSAAGYAVMDPLVEMALQ